MTMPNKVDFAARDTILNMLSDDENGRVSMAESKTALAAGVEYVDLDHLDQGIQRARAEAEIVMGNVIPRASVSDVTWNKIVAHLAS